MPSEIPEATIPRLRGGADTRTRIQQVALELFTERGYEATSLREIAERIGVTKAALYYHFKTKEDIVESTLCDRAALVQDLIDWAERQPKTIETRHEFLRRYSDMLYESGYFPLMRFFERNQSSMAKHPSGAQMRGRMLRIVEILTEPDLPLVDQIRRSLAIFALHANYFAVRGDGCTDEQRREAALEVALDLVTQAPPGEAGDAGIGASAVSP